MKANSGDVYTVYNKYLKCYTACQVAYIAPPDNVSKQYWAIIVSLDWMGNEPLTTEEIPYLKPIYKDFMYWNRELHLLKVSVDVPSNYIFVGNIPSLTNESCYSYGNWDNGYDVYLQLSWQSIPEGKRLLFKKTMNSNDEIMLGDNSVKICTHRIMDRYTPFDSALELKALPCLSEIVCEKWHSDLLGFLKDCPFIHELTLTNHNQKKLDFRGTSVTKLMIDMKGLDELWLSEKTEQLLFQNENPDNCIIHAKDKGSLLTVQFIGEYHPHPELSNLWGLHGIKIKNFDLSNLSSIHPQLKELRLWGEPGNLQNFSSLSNLQYLTNFSTYDLFGFSSSDIPSPKQMPNLKWFWMTSLPEDAAKDVKAKWKNTKDIKLRITKPRKSEWLAQNLDNPFRNWDGAEHIPQACAKKAANQYRKTRAQLLKLAINNDDISQSKAIESIIAYTQTFNKMQFIETIERDEIYMALCNILEAMPASCINKKELLNKFEELRDF